VLALGYQIDSSVMAHVAQTSDSQIVLTINDKIIASTISGKEEAELKLKSRSNWDMAARSHKISLANKSYLSATVLLHEGPPASVRCYILKSLQPVDAFLGDLTIQL
jgi:hypothetical protein